MMQGRAEIFHVGTRIRPLPRLDERGEGKENLGDCEKANRRSPEGAWKKSGVRHESHYPAKSTRFRYRVNVGGSYFRIGCEVDVVRRWFSNSYSM
jgi:hypothetical protein